MSGSIRARAADLAKLVELLIFPSFCLLCSKPLERPREKAVCRTCLAGLTPFRGAVCLCCGRFFDGAGESHPCRRCLEREPGFSIHRSCGKYGGVLKDLILLFKYRRISILSRHLARFADGALGAEDGLWNGVDWIVPVPLHPKRRRERGFNQSLLLARELAAMKNIKILDGCLVKVRNVPPQAGLEARDREKNARGAYAVRREKRIKGKTVLLVDDVYTTGATLRECSRVLRAAGAGDVRALTLAQA